MSKTNFGSRLAQFVDRFRWPVLLASIAIAMGLGMGASNLGFNNDYRVFFSEENPQLQAFDALQKKYTKDDNVFIVIAPKDGEVFTPDHLAAIQTLVDSAWLTPFSSRVDAITNFQHTQSVEDDLYVEDLVVDPEGSTPEEIADLKETAVNEPLLIHRLINEDATVCGVNIVVKIPEDTANAERAIASHVRTMVTDWEAQNPDLKTHLSGVVMLSNAFGEAAEGDFSTLFPLMFLVIIITMIIATRSVTGTIATLVVLMFSIMAAMGVAGLLGLDLTAVSAQAPTMILTLAVADSIHILVTMLQSMRKGMKKREAVVESLRINFLPVFITSATTVLGFLTLNFSDSPPFRDLGNIAAAGVTAAFFFSIILLPALMSILPVRVKVREEVAEKAPRKLFIDRLADFVLHHNKKLLWGSVAAILLFVFFASRNQLNEQFVGYFGKDIQFRSDTDFLNENLTGIYTLEFSVGSGEEGGISNPEYLANLEQFERWFEQQEKVVHVNAYTEVARRVNRSMHGDNEAYYKVPEDREEAAQYLLLYEMSLPLGLDLNNQINVDKSETRMIVTLDNATAGEMIALTEAGENWLTANTPEYMHTKGISTAIMFAHLTQRQIIGMAEGGLYAIVLITLVLIFALRSLKLGLLSLVPNLVPLLLAFGLWYLLDGRITSGLAVVFSMTIGIVVDDTVHILTKYLRARREMGYDSADAIRYSFQTVGRAVIITTAVLSAGFLILGQSSFKLNSGMAIMTAITILVALAIDLLFLPALLLLIKRK